MGGDTGLPGPCPAAEQDAGAFEVTFAFKHRVKTGYAGADSFVEGDLGKAKRCHRQYRDTVTINQKWIFVRAVG